MVVAVVAVVWWRRWRRWCAGILVCRYAGMLVCWWRWWRRVCHLGDDAHDRKHGHAPVLELLKWWGGNGGEDEDEGGMVGWYGGWGS